MTQPLLIIVSDLIVYLHFETRASRPRNKVNVPTVSFVSLSTTVNVILLPSVHPEYRAGCPARRSSRRIGASMLSLVSSTKGEPANGINQQRSVYRSMCAIIFDRN